MIMHALYVILTLYAITTLFFMTGMFFDHAGSGIWGRLARTLAMGVIWPYFVVDTLWHSQQTRKYRKMREEAEADPLRDDEDIFLPQRKIKYDPLKGFHYDDCEGEDDPTCWCEHRGPGSHYGGGIKPGWHREGCPMVGVPWTVTWDAWSDDNSYWHQPKCKCQNLRGMGNMILTLQSGEVHGPAPSPKPTGPSVVISGDEIHAILDGKDES